MVDPLQKRAAFLNNLLQQEAHKNAENPHGKSDALHPRNFHPEKDNAKLAVLKEDILTFANVLLVVNRAMEKIMEKDILRIQKDDTEVIEVLEKANNSKTYSGQLDSLINRLKQDKVIVNNFAEHDGNGNTHTTAHKFKDMQMATAVTLKALLDTLDDSLTPKQQATILQKGMWNPVGTLLNTTEEGTHPLTKEAIQFLEKALEQDTTLSHTYKTGAQYLQHLADTIERVFDEAHILSQENDIPRRR